MKKLSFDDKPSQFPTTQVKGGPLKPITQVLIDRRAIYLEIRSGATGVSECDLAFCGAGTVIV